MATVTASVRTTAKKAGNLKVYFRLTDGRKVQLFYRSEIEVDPNDWNGKKEELKYKAISTIDQRKKVDETNVAIRARKQLIHSVYEKDKTITSEILALKIDQFLHPEKYTPEQVQEIPKTYFEMFDQFLSQHKVSDGRRAHFRVLRRALQRYELYRKIKLDIHTITKEIIRDIEGFLLDEKSVFDEFPEIYKFVPESRRPQVRGINTVSGILSRFRTFCLWLIEEEKTTNNPFKGYSIDGQIYGTPFYLTIKERNDLYKFDLSYCPELAIQRDIFVFHCLIGCRIGDLYRLTANSIINGAVEYIASKTSDEKPVTIRVPLNATAKEILSKYQVPADNRLFPFISEANYNLAIKDMFKVASLTRMVTILESATRKEKKRPLYEVASSHLARRTFIGNLYKKVKDPSLVGSLSGHCEGSKAFARYRTIDDQMKQELVNLLD